MTVNGSSIYSNMNVSGGTQQQSSSTSDFASQLISEFDSDDSSSLSIEELGGISAEKFSKMDIDADGSVTEDELISSIEAKMQQMQSTMGLSNEESDDEDEDSFDPLQFLLDTIGDSSDSSESAATSGSSTTSDDSDSGQTMYEILQERMAKAGSSSSETNSFLSQLERQPMLNIRG